jgi:hypothetical protein
VGDVDGRFGRAIEVVQATLRQQRQGLALQLYRQGFAGADDPLQRGATGGVFVADEGLQHRRHEVQRADLLAADQLGQARRVAVVTRQRHDQACAFHQWPEKLPHRDVEAEWGLLQHAVIGTEWVSLLHPGQAVVKRHVAVAGALRFAGGARGVDDVGEVFRVQQHVRVVCCQSVPGFSPVQIEHGQPCRDRQAITQVRLGQQQGDAAVLEHIGQALLRVLRVERHIGATGLEDRQQADDHFHRTLGGDAHQHVRADAHATQILRQAVGLGIEFGIAQGAFGEGQCRRLRLTGDLLFEQLMNVRRARVIARRGVPVPDHLLALIGLQQRQFTQRAIRLRHELHQQLGQLPGDAANGRLGEILGQVVEGQLQFLAHLGDQRQRVATLLAVTQVAEAKAARGRL